MLLLWWLSMVQVISLSSWWKKFFISLVLSIILFVSVVAEFHLIFEIFSISPLQGFSFRCWFSNNSVINFLEGCFPSSLVAKVVIFFSFPLSQRSSFYSFVMEALWCCSFHSSSRIVKIMFFLFLIHSTGVSCPPFKFSHLIKFCLPSQLECCLKSFLPIVPFFQ